MLTLPTRAPLPPVPTMLLAALSIEGGAALAKTVFPALGLFTTLGLRVALSAVLLGLIFRPGSAALRRNWRQVVPYGLALGLMNLTFYLAIARLPLGVAVTLEFTGPLLLSLTLSRRLLDAAWAALAGLGVLLLSSWSGALDPFGVVCALAAGACWAAYILLGQRVAQVLPSLHGVTLGMLVAAVLILPLGLADAGLTRITPTLALLALGVAALSSALPYALEMRALQQLPARTFSVLLSLSPAMAAGCGAVFLGEQLSVVQCVAVALVMAASLGVTLTARPAAPAA